MKARGLPLALRIGFWFTLNVSLLAAITFLFLRSEFKLGLDWMLAGGLGQRMAQLGDEVTRDFSRLSLPQWQGQLQDLGQRYGVEMAIFDNEGRQVSGLGLEPPPELRPLLLDRRGPGQPKAGPRPRPAAPKQRSAASRPLNSPRKPQFFVRAGSPPFYWAGVHLDLIEPRDGRALTLLLRSPNLLGNGFFLESRPWIWLLAGGLILSVFIWLPVVRGITRSIGQLNEAAGRIAGGGFDERLEVHRGDELGDLAHSVNAMASQLGEYVAQQRRITADIAHELCSPIARMQMALGVLEQRAQPDQQAYVQRLDRELQHMAALVEEVLAFSRAERLPQSEAASLVDINALLGCVMEREAPEAEIALALPEALQWPTHAAALDRALGNVLRNAVRYACEIRIEGEISPASSLHLRILDRGPGVPPEALPRLFEPFFRPEAARSRNSGGSGLGLAIAQRCMQACKAEIRAFNREGGGLGVEFILPALPLPAAQS